MAYKISYKVVSEQGDQLKKTAKDMDNYINQLNQIISKLGNDELLQSVRSDLNKFSKQLEAERTVLDLAGQVITDVVQAYTGTEKKSVQKVDKAKAHNRDFYKRPVAVASAGGGVAAGASGAAAAAASASASATVNVSGGTTNNYTINYTAAPSGTTGSTFVEAGLGAGLSGAASTVASTVTSSGGAAAGSALGTAAVAAAAGLAAAGGGVAGAVIYDKYSEKENSKDE